MDTTALTIVNNAKAKGALIYVDMNSLNQMTELYRAEATETVFDKKQFHSMKGGKFQPDKATTDKIGELSGITFIPSASSEKLVHRKDSICGERDSWIVTAQGKKLCSDGNWQESNIEAYEFDPCVRAMEELGLSEVTETNKPAYNRKVIEFTKVALARAKTGARLRVIRALAGLPSSFDADDIKKPMVFSRVVMNTAFVLSTPEGRTMATAKALDMDVSSLLFGNKKPDPAQAIAASAEKTPSEADMGNLRSANEPETEPEPAADTVSLADQANPGEGSSEEFKQLTIELEEMVVSFKEMLNVNLPSGMNPFTLAQAELDDFTATVETRKSMIKRTTDFLKARKVAV